MNKVVAVILNYNSSTDCRKCISFLKKQDYGCLDIVVVDNASTQDDVEKIKQICSEKDVTLIVNDNNQGFSAGNNVGLCFAASVKADWALIINPDVELRNSHYIKFVMEQVKAWKDVVVAGTDVRLPSGDRQNPMRKRTYFEECVWPVEIVKHHMKCWDRYLGPDKSGYCDMVHGSCMFLKMGFFEKRQFLDNRIFLYCEEEILSSIVESSRKKLLYLKEVTAYHKHYENKKGLRGKRMDMYFKSRWYYFQRYSKYNKIQLILLKVSLWTWKMYWKLRKV